MVTRADKGQTTVVMDRKVYFEKMELLLNDQSTYKKLKRDPSKMLTKKINELVKSWRNNDLISEMTFRSLNCTNGNLPRCYGLPKIHKDGFPLRIIVSALGSPVYNISSFIHDILHKSIKKPDSYIKDSWSFVTNIRNTSINDDYIMISLDVSSLFTNIPKDLVLDAIRKRWDDIAKHTKFSLAQFLYATEVILDSTCFVFDGRFYEQIFGTPMGSPLSPILADMVMDDLETQCLNSLDFIVPTYYRFVDDVFAIVPRTKIEKILTVFNNYHQRLKFTYEIEINSSISFLNATVIRSDNRLITNWYRKPTWSGRYINYYSNHPLKFKINTIYNLVDHAILLSDDRFQQKNIALVHDTLLNNCFPEHIVKRHILKRINFLKNRDHNNTLDTDHINFDKTSFISLPYVNNASYDLGRLLRGVGLNVVYKITKKLNILIKRGKDVLQNNDKTNVVYKLNCQNCNMSYVGQTKRHLRTRVREHCNNIKLHETNHSVLSKHRLEFRHEFDWSKPNILHSEKYVRKREIAEMFYIKKFNNVINLQKDTDSLNNIYDKIIKVV